MSVDKINLMAMSTPELDLIQCGIGLLFCIVASLLLRSVYIKRSLSISGKFHIGTVIPLLSSVTYLVIIVVKSSLALSLGLVGALSIVRFRTPIKEPEELVYLFLAIGIGLGYGAGQYSVTTMVFATILLLIVTFLSRQTAELETEFNIMLECAGQPLSIERVRAALDPYTDGIEISRFARSGGRHTAFFKVSFKPGASMDGLGRELAALGGDIDYSITEARALH